MNQLVPRSIKVSLAEAANDLQTMMRMLEDGQDIAPYMDQFSLADDHAVAAIDRRKYILKEVSAKIDVLQRMRDEISSHMEKLKEIDRKVRQTTKDVVEANPDVSFRDGMGNKVYLCKGPRSKMNLEFETTSANIKYILKDEDFKNLVLHGYGQYVKRVSYDVLDTEALRKDIEEGQPISFASLETTTHVRGL